MRKFLTLACAALLLASNVLGQGGGATIVPGDNLVVEGVPAIPASLAEEVRRYTEFRSAGLAGWHPARREMLIGTRFGDTNQVHLVKTPGGARTQLTFFPDRAGAVGFRPKTGDYFVFNKDTGGNEFYQYYRYDVATGDVTLLTDGKSRNTSADWSNGGEWLAYSSTRRNGRDNDILLVNPARPDTTRVLAQNEGGGWGASDWSPDDKQLLVVEFLSANESYLWLIDAATGAKTLVTPKGGAEKVSYGGGEFSRDGRGLYVTTDRGSEFRRLTYLDLATKEHTYLTDHIKWDVDSFRLSPDGRSIAFVTNEDGVGRLRLLDTRTRKELPAPRLPVGLVGGLNWHENGRDLGFNLSSARSTSDVYSLDVRTGKVERWTESETGGLNTSQLPEPELIKWKSFDGREMSGFLYMPPARYNGPRPVIINIHGGPEGQARPGFIGRNNYFLNEMGVAMLFPNVRGSSGYGKTFLQLDNGFKREDTYKDIGTLLDWIAVQPRLDKERV
ncbi:MAG TPA: prolyl oligopeptidase family serine peptidase, partial [Pyrinomonadaceae bacterium]|nr:prolyl oligopeptidase family serine peptidase [Pyrinomonadaceae bacterium]